MISVKAPFMSPFTAARFSSVHSEAVLYIREAHWYHTLKKKKTYIGDNKVRRYYDKFNDHIKTC
ncbi:UNVERIFIED_CONTAM: hypothetical protein FKN15_044209 [Acipenser sinensis]